MDKEKIFVTLVILGVVAIVFLKFNPVAVNTAGPDIQDRNPNLSLVPTPANAKSGLDYMVYNTPWYFAPPIANFLPAITQGQGGQSDIQTVAADDTYDCGCS